ncbi:hypothetical protein ACIQRK_25490 [Streptomyces anulatus]
MVRGPNGSPNIKGCGMVNAHGLKVFPDPATHAREEADDLLAAVAGGR